MVSLWRARRWGAVALVAGLGMGVMSPAANATPTDDLLTRAAALQRELTANETNIETLAEQYNGAIVRRDFAVRQMLQGQLAITDLKQRRGGLGSSVRAHLARLYRESGRGGRLSGLESSNRDDARRRSAYSNVVTRRDDAMIGRLQRVESQLELRAQRLEEYRRRADAETVLAGMAKSRAEALQVKQQALLASAQGEIGDVLRLKRAAQDPGASALEARLRLLGVNGLPAAPNPKAAFVVAYAVQQLGKPYVFAAAGPDTFDCSGLTLMAWRQAGVSMAHFAATQYEEFPRVSVDALAPGDLVFFYPTIHHVGIYIGDGKMIHAPHTGDVVRVASIFRASLVGAVRPQ
ncbi:MAG: C40 family peptidase [Acidimicrobiia bacterium]